MIQPRENERFQRQSETPPVSCRSHFFPLASEASSRARNITTEGGRTQVRELGLIKPQSNAQTTLPGRSAADALANAKDGTLGWHMIPKRFFPVMTVLFLWSAACWTATAALSKEQETCLRKGKRFERAGWVYLHVEGEPRERGFQHGYLLAKEIAEGLRVTQIEWRHQSSMDWP